jgi:hypothetical protein
MAIFAGLDVSQDKATICIVSDQGSSEEQGVRMSAALIRRIVAWFAT